MHMHTGMQTYMQVCWWMFVCFPQGCYSPGAGEEWQMVGVSQSFRVAGLIEVLSVRDVVSPGLSVAGGVWTEQS